MKTLIEKGIILKRQSQAFGKNVYLLGKDSEGIKYWLEAPKFECGWYWGFGYVETYQRNSDPQYAKDIDSHSHISGLLGTQERYDFDKSCFVKGEYIHNLIDNNTFESTTFTEKESWELSELFTQFYILQKMAEFYHTGGAHMSTANIPTWKDQTECDRINQTMIPVITKRIIEILTPVEELA